MEEKISEHMIVDELADEIVNLLSNSQKFSKFLEKIDSQTPHTTNDTEMRIENIEQKLNKLIHNFKVVSVELERMSTEKIENLRQEHDEEIMRMQSQIEQIKQAVMKLASEIKDIRSARF
jgi:hypothetical protein